MASCVEIISRKIVKVIVSDKYSKKNFFTYYYKIEKIVRISEVMSTGNGWYFTIMAGGFVNSIYSEIEADIKKDFETVLNLMGH